MGREKSRAVVKEYCGHLDPFQSTGLLPSGTVAGTGITWTSNATSAANYYNAADVLNSRT